MTEMPLLDHNRDLSMRGAGCTKLHVLLEQPEGSDVLIEVEF